MEYEDIEIIDAECCKCFAPIVTRADDMFPLCKKCEYDFLMSRS